MAASGYSPISLYYSTTASATPTNTNLVNGELALNITDGKLFYKDNAGTVQTLATKAATSGSFSTTTISTSETLSYGTANGVAYLNGSKVVTTGSALTFDGTNLSGTGSIGTTIASKTAQFNAAGGSIYASFADGTTTWRIGAGIQAAGRFDLYDVTNAQTSISVIPGASGYTAFFQNNTEQMRLTSTGLGIGTSSPVDKLEVYSTITARAASGTSALRLRNTTSDYQWQTVAGTNAINLYDNAVGSSRLTVDSSGNLGIGTSSPGYKLDVNGTARFNNTFDFGAGQSITSGSGAYRAAKFGAASGAYNVLFSGSTAFQINDNADTANLLVLTNSGNLGLGVTPSAWNSTSKAIQVSAFVSVSQQASGAANFGFNFYEDAANTFKYSTTDEACRFSALTTGGFGWFTAPSGTAGNAISFTQAMTLDASGNLGLGTSSPSTKLHIAGNTFRHNDATGSYGYTISAATNTTTLATLFGGSSFAIQTGASGTNQFLLDASGNLGIGTSSPTVNLHVYNASSAEIRTASANIGLQLYSSEGAGTSVIGTYTNHALVFRTNATERARITSGGEVYIAGTTDQGAYNLQVNGTGVWGAGAYVNGSDARLKEEVQDLAPALDVIASLRPVTFRYKEDYSKDQNVQPGFIAQELQTAMAGQAYVDGVIQSGPQHLNVAYQSLIPLLTKAIQELKAEFDAYKATHP